MMQVECISFQTLKLLTLFVESLYLFNAYCSEDLLPSFILILFFFVTLLFTFNKTTINAKPSSIVYLCIPFSFYHSLSLCLSISLSVCPYASRTVYLFQ